MILRSLNFYKHQIKFLKKIGGSFSEHVRRAVDEYIERIKSSDVSASRSEKVGETNG